MAATQVPDARRTSRPPATTSTLARAGLAALVVLPVVVAAVVLVRTPWHPFIDAAVHELRVRDVLSTSPPLLGPAATFDGTQGELSHPGPMVFLAYALPYVLSGASSYGLGIGAALVNGAALIGALVVANRRGGAALSAVTAVVLAALVHGIGIGALVDSWNPLVATLPMFLLVLLVWSIAVGDLALAPVTVLVGSFVAQAHLGLLPYVVALTLVAGIGAGVAVHRERRRTAPEDRASRSQRARRLGLVTLLVGLACWLPPLVEQVTADDGGNLGRIAASITSERREPVAGRRTAVQIIASEVGSIPPWVVRVDRPSGTVPTVAPSSPIGLLVPAGAAVVATVLAWRGRRRDTLVLLGLVGVLAATAVPTVAGISGPIYAHYVRALWVVGAGLWLAVLWSILQAVLARPAGRRAVSRGAVPIAAVLAATIGLASIVQRPDPITSTPRLQAYADVADDAVPAIADAVAGRGPVEVLADGSTEGWAAQTGLQLQLEKAGLPITVRGGRRAAAVYGEQRTDLPPALVVEVATADRAEARRARPDLRPLHTGTTPDGEPLVVFAHR